MSFLGLGGGGGFNPGPAQGYIDTLRGIGTELGSQWGAANNQYNTNNTDWQNAINAYAKYLNTNAGTEQNNANQVANAERGSQEGADRAIANTEAGLASRGISMKSGIGAGSLAGINASLAANNADIQSAVGQNNIDRNAANKAALVNLQGGATDTTFGRADRLGQERSGLYQNLFGDQNELSQEQYASDQAKNQGWANLLGGVGAFAKGIPWASVLSGFGKRRGGGNQDDTTPQDEPLPPFAAGLY